MSPYASFPDAVVSASIYSMIISASISILLYVFLSLSLYSIAKRRGLPGAGWAWVPVGGSAFVMGSIADQYDFTTKGVQKKQRFLLLWLNLGLFFACLLLTVLLAVFVSKTIALSYHTDFAQASGFLSLALAMLVTSLGVMALAVLYLVFMFISLHKVYRSCSPASATVFLVLSILFSFLQAFFLFAVRKKDKGMIPMAPAAPETPAQPMYTTPAQPMYAEPAVQAQPMYTAPAQPMYTEPAAPVQPMYTAPAQPMYAEPAAEAAPAQPGSPETPEASAQPMPPEAPQC